MTKKNGFVGIVLTVLVLLVEYRFFFIIRIPAILQRTMTYHNKTLLLLISIFFLMIFGLYVKKIHFTTDIALFLILIGISTWYSYSQYSPRFNEILIPLFAYLSIILYFPLRRVLLSDYESFVKIITIFNVIACLILIAQYFYYEINTNLFLSIYEFYRSGQTAIRNNHLRITYLGTVISLSAVLSIGQLFSNKSKKIHFFNLFLSFIYFFVVSQTRMYVFALLGVIAFQYNKLFSKNRNNILGILFWILFGIIMFFSLGLNDYILAMLKPILDGSYVSNGSYYARIESIEYFYSVLKNKPILGLGLFDPDLGSPYYYLVHSLTGHAMYTDVGILGNIAQFGFPMSIWFLIVMFKMYKIKKIVSDNTLDSLFLFIIFTSLTLIILDPQRIFFLTCTLAIFDSKFKNESLKTE